MPNRVQKPKSRKTNERDNLSALVFAFGCEMPRCARCQAQGLACYFSYDHSEKCGSCIKAGVPCDAQSFSSAAAQRLLSEKSKLDDEEARAEQESLLASQALQQALLAVNASQSRLSRARKQRQLLQSRAEEMIRRGFRDVEGIPEGDMRIREAETARMANVAPEVTDWSSIDLESFDFSAFGNGEISLGAGGSFGGSR